MKRVKIYVTVPKEAISKGKITSPILAVLNNEIKTELQDKGYKIDSGKFPIELCAEIQVNQIKEIKR